MTVRCGASTTARARTRCGWRCKARVARRRAALCRRCAHLLRPRGRPPGGDAPAGPCLARSQHHRRRAQSSASTTQLVFSFSQPVFWSVVPLFFLPISGGAGRREPCRGAADMVSRSVLFRDGWTDRMGRGRQSWDARTRISGRKRPARPLICSAAIDAAPSTSGDRWGLPCVGDDRGGGQGRLPLGLLADWIAAAPGVYIRDGWMPMPAAWPAASSPHFAMPPERHPAEEQSTNWCKPSMSRLLQGAAPGRAAAADADDGRAMRCRPVIKKLQLRPELRARRRRALRRLRAGLSQARLRGRGCVCMCSTASALQSRW